MYPEVELRSANPISMGENPPGLVWDVLQRALKSTLEASGQTFWTVVFAVLCAAGFWWRQCRREGRPFLSFPSGWKSQAVDYVLVTVVVLAIIFVPKVLGAIQDRDAGQQTTIQNLRDEVARKPGVVSGVPIVPENPDHASLLTRLEAAEGQLAVRDRELVDVKLQVASKDTQLAAFEARIREMERDLAAARQRADAERARGDELQRKLGAASAQQTQCDQLASLSGTGRQLAQKLFATRAAPETRREIDQWYAAVCAAMSKNQCEAFLAAPRARDMWVGYPVEDGGYQQTLRGRSEYLSSRLSTLCR